MAVDVSDLTFKGEIAFNPINPEKITIDGASFLKSVIKLRIKKGALIGKNDVIYQVPVARLIKLELEYLSSRTS